MHQVGPDGKLQASQVSDAVNKLKAEARRAELATKLKHAEAMLGAQAHEVAAAAAKAAEARRRELNVRPGAALLRFKGSVVITNCLQFEREDGTPVQLKLVVESVDEVSRQLALRLWRCRSRKYTDTLFQAVVVDIPYRNAVSALALKLADGESAGISICRWW